MKDTFKAKTFSADTFKVATFGGGAITVPCVYEAGEARRASAFSVDVRHPTTTTTDTRRAR